MCKVAMVSDLHKPPAQTRVMPIPHTCAESIQVWAVTPGSWEMFSTNEFQKYFHSKTYLASLESIAILIWQVE